MQLWPSSLDTPVQFDKEIKKIVWSGQEDSKQPRVAYAIFLRPKSKGSFGLISMKAQFIAMARVFILNVATDGDGTLQHIIDKNIGDLPTVHNGDHDFSWLVSHHAPKPKGKSIV